jgi:cytochrome c553
MRLLKLALPSAILMAGFLVCTTASYGTAEYAKKEKKSCTFCHAKMVADKAEMAKNQTDAGKYYKEHNHSLDGYKAPAK